MHSRPTLIDVIVFMSVVAHNPLDFHIANF